MVLTGDEMATMVSTLRTSIPFDIVYLSGMMNTTGYWASSMVALYPKVLDHAKGPIFPKMTYYEDHFMHFTEDGLRERPRYIEIEARQALCKPRVEIF